ncbi:MAG: zinc ribbon domain-containing protein [Dehalococcoidia bacterium]|nr:zinc ribbon domain-containing protein [Dehalococcoidia bacterium]
MPIYEYRCLSCGKISEIFLRGSESEDIECPLCGSKNLEKLLPASYAIKMNSSMSSRTCCGRIERCEVPPCSEDATCRRSN